MELLLLEYDVLAAPPTSNEDKAVSVNFRPAMPAPSSTRVSKINMAAFFLLTSPTLVFSAPLCYFLSFSPSRCLAPQQHQQQSALLLGTRRSTKPNDGNLQPGSECFSPTSHHPSPSGETHLFDLRCDYVFPSSHLQLPLTHVLPPTHPFGLSLINRFHLEKQPSSS